MTAKINSGRQIKARISCAVPEGKTPEAFMDELRAAGNPVVRYLKRENRVLLAELVGKPGLVDGVLKKLKRMG